MSMEDRVDTSTRVKDVLTVFDPLLRDLHLAKQPANGALATAATTAVAAAGPPASSSGGCSGGGSDMADGVATSTGGGGGGGGGGGAAGEYRILSIREDRPERLLRNGQPLPPESLARAQMSNLRPT